MKTSKTISASAAKQSKIDVQVIVISFLILLITVVTILAIKYGMPADLGI